MYLQKVVIRKNLVIISIVLLLAGIILALPMMDTATQYMIEETLKYSNDYMVFLLPVIFISFCLQFCWLNLHRWLCWLLPILSLVLIAVAELYWIKGGSFRELLFMDDWISHGVRKLFSHPIIRLTQAKTLCSNYSGTTNGSRTIFRCYILASLSY